MEATLFALLRQRLVLLQVNVVSSAHHFISALVHLIPSCGPALASFWLPLDFKREIYSDAFHLKRSDTHCSYQQFESANHLKQEK